MGKKEKSVDFQPPERVQQSYNELKFFRIFFFKKDFKFFIEKLSL